MKLKEILELWEKDSVIDTTKIPQESANIPLLHHKYYSILSKEKLILDNLNISLKELELKRWNFYNRTGDPEDYKDYDGNFFDLKLLKKDTERFLEADEQLISYKKKIAMQKNKVETLTEILKMIANRSFQIKNYIDYKKFEAGEY